jgi:hypothetical protein
MAMITIWVMVIEFFLAIAISLLLRCFFEAGSLIAISFSLGFLIVPPISLSLIVYLA